MRDFFASDCPSCRKKSILAKVGFDAEGDLDVNAVK